MSDADITNPILRNLRNIILAGAERAQILAQQTIDEIVNSIGFVPRG